MRKFVKSCFVVMLIISAVSVAYAENKRYTEGQSNQEICIRNHGGTWSCIEDKDYRDLFAGVIKNGGCITSVPDVGNMVREWKYCQNTSEKINVLYSPNGDTIILNKAIAGDLGNPPMTDTEYKQELDEYYKQ